MAVIYIQACNHHPELCFSYHGSCYILPEHSIYLFVRGRILWDYHGGNNSWIDVYQNDR
jgi:hypothetical protein